MFYLKNFRNEGDNFLKEFFNPDSGNILRTDVKEDEENYTLSVEIPGIKKEDVSLEVEDGYLTITASSKEENTEENETFIRQERRFGAFTRRFYVGEVSEKDISAKSLNGILTIKVPKNVVAKEVKKAIDINWE